MYKFTSHLANPNLVMVRKKLGDGTLAALVLLRAPRRHAHYDPNKCPPPKEKPNSHKFLWTTVGATVLTGAAVVYAKGSPEARNWLASNMPWADNFIALVYQENTTYGKFAMNQFGKATSSISHFMFGKEGVSPPEIKPANEQDIDKECAVGYAKKDYELPPTKFEPLYVEEKEMETPNIQSPAMIVRTDKCDPSSEPPINITKDIVTLELEMHDNTKTAIDNYKLALKHCVTYNKVLYQIIEASFEDLDKKNFSTLQGAQNERDSAYAKAKASAVKARLAIDTLDSIIKSGVQAPPDSVAQTQRFIKQFRRDLDDTEAAFLEEKRKAILSDKYWNKVDAARNYFKSELQLLFPGINLASKDVEFKGDVDLLLLYTMKTIQYLQKELAEIQTVRDLKLSRAVECHDEKALIEAKAEDIVKKERLSKDVEFQKKSLEIQAEANKRMRDQLKRQYETQQDVMQDRLKRKEAEILATFNKALSEKMQEERVKFKKDLATMAGKLQAIERTLKERAAGEAAARASQSLWAAAEALLAATRAQDNRAHVNEQIKALEKAGKDDRLVQTVLKGIPEEVRKNGIVTERRLREAFDQMEKTALKVALVGRDGATLPVYFLSWLQSKLLFSKYTEIPQDELDNLPTDFTELDTFDIMQRARYHMDRGCLSSALRYVNLLQGAARAAACGWVGEARAHLETRQAAEAVMAHASAAGLLYL